VCVVVMLNDKKQTQGQQQSQTHFLISLQWSH